MNLDDLTSAQRRRFERAQLIGLVVLFAALVGSRIAFKVAHVDWWVTFACFAFVAVLDVVVMTFVIARITNLAPSHVAWLGRQSVVDATKGKVNAITSRLRR